MLRFLALFVDFVRCCGLLMLLAHVHECLVRMQGTEKYMHLLETTAERLVSVTSDNQWSKIEPLLSQFLQQKAKLSSVKKGDSKSELKNAGPTNVQQ